MKAAFLKTSFYDPDARKLEHDPGHSEREIDFPRTPGQIDRDRILYSGHFLRLAEVTQTISPVHGYVFHNRLSHSLKVGQVSRRLCERLKRRYAHDTSLGPVVDRLDPDVCEAVGLAHDLGHPPFGHSTEKQLNEKLGSKENLGEEWGLDDAFEGNAQSFRIVCRLGGTHLPTGGLQPSIDYEYSTLGLNLTRRTLNGILKYPWVRDKDCSRRNRKWGAYGTDRVFLDFAREGLEEGNDRKSLEAEIMDWADDITFAVHDLLDFYASGDIPIYFFLPDLRNLYKGIDMDERVKFIADIVADPHNYKLIENAQKLYDSTLDPKICLNGVLDGVFERHLSRLHSRYTGTDKQRGSISAIAFGMIEDCLQAFKLRVGEDDGLGPWRVWKDLRPEVEIDILKQFTWHYVIRGQQLQCEELGQQRAVRTVFDTFMNAARSNNGEDRYLFPWHMREQVHDERTSQDKTRRVVDYVASMSEPELMRIYRQLIADNGYRQ